MIDFLCSRRTLVKFSLKTSARERAVLVYEEVGLLAKDFFCFLPGIFGEDNEEVITILKNLEFVVAFFVRGDRVNIEKYRTKNTLVEGQYLL